MLDENVIADLVRRRVVSDTFRRLTPDKKLLVYRAATHLFGEYGYDGLAVDRICHDAGISKGRSSSTSNPRAIFSNSRFWFSTTTWPNGWRNFARTRRRRWPKTGSAIFTTHLWSTPSSTRPNRSSFCSSRTPSTMRGWCWRALTWNDTSGCTCGRLSRAGYRPGRLGGFRRRPDRVSGVDDCGGAAETSILRSSCAATTDGGVSDFVFVRRD